MPTIIYPPTIDFAWLFQRPQQLLREMAGLGYKVLFYNHDHYFKQNENVVKVYPNFWLCTPETPWEELPLEYPIILWISYPPNVEFIGRYQEKLVVFDAIDEASGEFAHWAGDLDRAAAKADIIFATAQKLYDYHKNKHLNVYMCPNGADYKHFSPAQGIISPKPFDMPDNQKPVIGYFGAIAPWIDWELMNYISEQNHDVNFVMIGPLYGEFKDIVTADNIYYLGRKNYLELPEYLQYFDVCIIPFQVTSMTEACNPIKMYEYQSAGKPIVSTDMPEVRNIEGLYVGRTREEFNQYLREALEDKDFVKKMKRMKIAKANSWLNRAKIIDAVIKEKLKDYIYIKSTQRGVRILV
ncbi:glycosyltransferase [Syntrophomonas palmitatica]|uniref:glycosyltransferase n=1 Tax=Syntrophomonas palmitatica TaxID=402877 RepID=UPI0006D01052|nr:glycosyltransferase [Syntrophomonas palmitatica]